MVLIRAVLLDLDETLYDERGSVAGALEVAAAYAAERYPQVKRELLGHVYLEEGNKRWEAFEEEIRVKGRGAQLDPLRVREMCFAQALAAAGAPPSFAPELTRYYGEQRKGRHTLFPEVKKCLEKLRRQASVALVSNGSSGYQREKLRSTGVEGLFHAIVISEEAGYSKPQKAIFERALRDLGVPASEAVMVGDNLEKDIAGAKLCGMRGVLIRRDGDRPRFHNGQVRPDAVIDSLSDLTRAITAFAGKRVG